MTTDLQDLFAGMALFADLSEAQRQEVAHTFEEHVFDAGERILREGISGTSFYVILDGRATVVREGVTVATIGRGDFFGEISILLGELPIADVVAETTLTCVQLPGQRLEEFLLSHPTVAYRMLQGQARRLRMTTRWVS